MDKSCCLLLGICCLLAGCRPDAGESIAAGAFMEWSTYRGDPTSSQFSGLDQINSNNVKSLQPAWTYRTGGSGSKSTIECNPIVVNGRLYGTSPDLKVFALDAATGTEHWVFDPSTKHNLHSGVNRGLTHWAGKAGDRILFTSGHFLYAVDAIAGQLIPSFGDSGRVDLRYHLEMEPEAVSLTVTSPGVVFGDLIILGSAVGEGYGASPGHVRAYDVRTGEWQWTFHTIPQPGQLGYDTWQWEEGEQYGGANAWGGLSLDEKRGWVFVATGSAAFDFYGGNRLGANLFANCVLALDARTGERQWHFQTVHHDIWDYDLPCAPNLLNIRHEGEEREVVVQPTKMGHIFVLDRETGQPVFPVEERSLPISTVPGEIAWPTQPFPSLPEPFTRQGITWADLSNITPESEAFVREQFRNMRGGTIFTPPSLEGTVSMPGTRGGAEWSGAAVDPHRGILYINANEIPNILQLKAVEQTAASEDTKTPMARGRQLFQNNCSTCHGLERQGAPPIYPSLIGLQEKYPATEVMQLIRTGKGSMPGFAQFSEEELAAITAFLLDPPQATDADGVQAASGTAPRYLINGYRQFLDQDGYPGIRPPWGTLSAIDLNTGKRRWRKVLGEYPALREKGIPATGTQNLGGCIVTAGGLLFIGATQDEMFRAFDSENGDLLWEYQLPAGGYATPSTYAIDGKQFVVIAAGGGGKNGTAAGDYYLAFALEDR